MTNIITGCIACGRYLHNECGDPCCCISEDKATGVVTPKEINTPVALSLNPNDPYENATIIRGRPKKSVDAIIDPHSTGRKRAAKLYPIDGSAPCDWRLKKNCGGGKRPIVGCMDGLQIHIHHGPDKNTLNNAVNNVHRICNKCHNRWHYLNDGDYDDSAKLNIHNPVEATLEEVVQNNIRWIKDEFSEITAMRVARFNQRGNKMTDTGINTVNEMAEEAMQDANKSIKQTAINELTRIAGDYDRLRDKIVELFEVRDSDDVDEIDLLVETLEKVQSWIEEADCACYEMESGQDDICGRCEILGRKFDK